MVVAGPDGKPVYVDEQEAIGKTPYFEPQGASQSASSLQEYEKAKSEGYKGDYLAFLRDQAQARYVAQPQEPLVAVQTPNGAILVPRSQAAGMTPAAGRETPSGDERAASNYFGRMEAAEKGLGNYVPSITDYTAAQQLMSGGPIRAGMANAVLSEEGQSYYQYAADWVRAKLRKESGAVISPEEMAQEIKTYFPVPGDSQKTVDQKKRARKQAMEGMKNMGGRAVAPPMVIDPNNAGPQTDPLGILGR